MAIDILNILTRNISHYPVHMQYTQRVMHLGVFVCVCPQKIRLHTYQSSQSSTCIFAKRIRLAHPLYVLPEMLAFVLVVHRMVYSLSIHAIIPSESPEDPLSIRPCLRL